MKETKIKNVGILLYDEKKRILLVRQRRGFTPPGGSVEAFDKTLFEAAVREFYEETSVKFPFKRNECNKWLYRNRRHHCLCFFPKFPLTEKNADEIMRNFDVKKILYEESDDIKFVCIDKIIFNPKIIVRGKLGKTAPLASFVKRVTLGLVKSLEEERCKEN